VSSEAFNLVHRSNNIVFSLPIVSAKETIDYNSSLFPSGVSKGKHNAGVVPVR